MRFPADESCDFAVVRALRTAGHDVIAVSEISRDAEDSAVVDLARTEQRVLLTEDKDFGQLVFAAAHESAGVILVRWPVGSRSSLGAALVELVGLHGEALASAFVVVEPGRVRISR